MRQLFGMKRLLFVFLFFLTTARVLPDGIGGNEPVVYDQGFIHPYGMVAYKNMILVSNYGFDATSDKLVQGKGYICAIQGGVVKPFIRADGHLTAPKGMAVYENFLFVADLNKIVVYNLKKIVNPPIEINFPASESVLTDIETVGSMLLVSVNDSGKIFVIDLNTFPSVDNSGAVLMAEVPGAGNMTVFGTNLYVNSFPSEIRDSSLVYVADLTGRNNGEFKPLIKNMSPGQYLGVAVSEEKRLIFFSALKTDEIYRPMLYASPLDGSQSPRVVDTGFNFSSPTSILVNGTSLWIIDHLQSKVFRYNIE